MDFNQLRTFVSVVETGSFSRAGARLFLSQPTVTIQVKLLEKELCQQLLVRSTNGVTVTEEGKKFFEYAKRTLRERQGILEEFGQDISGMKRINVAASSIPGQFVMPTIIAAFRKENPLIRVQLTLCNSAKVCQYLLERRADIGLGGSDSFQNDCDYYPIVDDTLVVITPNSGIYKELRQGSQFSEQLLRSTPFIAREEGSGSRREFERWLHRYTNITDMNITSIINDNHSIIRAVLAGAGISVMSARAVTDDVAMGRLLAFPLDGITKRNLYLIRRKKTKLMGEVAELYQFIKNYIDKHEEIIEEDYLEKIESCSKIEEYRLEECKVEKPKMENPYFKE